MSASPITTTNLVLKHFGISAHTTNKAFPGVLSLSRATYMTLVIAWLLLCIVNLREQSLWPNWLLFWPLEIADMSRGSIWEYKPIFQGRRNSVLGFHDWLFRSRCRSRFKLSSASEQQPMKIPGTSTIGFENNWGEVLIHLKIWVTG